MKRLFVLMLLLPSLAWAGPTLEGLRLSAEFSRPTMKLLADWV